VSASVSACVSASVTVYAFASAPWLVCVSAWVGVRVC